MLAATQARARLLTDNAKAKEKVQELQAFAQRFAANKSKSRQATSRLKLADKIKENMVEVKPSSRQNPYIRFDVEDKAKLHRFAFDAANLSKSFDKPLIQSLTLILEAGQKLAVIGGNGVGKSTLMKLLVGQLAPDAGTVKWAEKSAAWLLCPRPRS